MTVPVSWYLILSALLFALGTIGALTRRNGITIFLSIELMLNSVNLSLVAFARTAATRYGHLQLAAAYHGKLIVFFVLAVAAAEAAVGLALFIAIYRNRRTIDVNRMNLMRW